MVLFVSLLLLAVAGTPAFAGEFPVKQCRGSLFEGFFGEYGQPTTVDRVDVVRGCTPNGSGKIGVYQDRSGASAPSGSGGQFIWATGTGIRIVGSTVTAKLKDANGIRASVFGFNQVSGPIDLYDGQPHDGELRTTRWATTGPKADLVVARLICNREAGCPNEADGPKAYFEIFDLELVAEDYIPPSVTFAGELGGLGDSGRWVRGEHRYSVAASDWGSGVARAFLEVNGFEVDLPVAPCADDRGGYATGLTPCPLALDHDGTVDTSAAPFNEGSNSLRACVADFAVPGSSANRTCSPAKTLLVDNRPPAQPAGLEAIGGSNWRAVNRFEFSWQIPEGQDAPVVGYEYRVIDTDGDHEVDRGEVAGDQPVTAGPFSVPGPGTYRVEIRLLDEAGNLGAPASVLIRFDDSPPGDAAPEQPDGWVSADELPIEQPIEQATPGGPSGIEGYAVSVSREGPVRPCQGEVCSPSELAMTGGAADRVAVISNLAEGSHWISSVAASGARIPSRETGSTVIQVDKTDPVTSLSGVPDGWSDRPVTVTATATDDLSGMESQPGDDGRPVTVISAEGQNPYEAPGPEASFTVAGEGADPDPVLGQGPGRERK